MQNAKPVTINNVLDFYKGLTSDDMFVSDLAIEFAENSDHSTIYVEGVKKTIFTYFNGADIINNSEDYCKYRSKEERLKVLDDIDFIVTDKTEEQQKLAIKQILSNIEYYLKELEGWKNYTFFAADLKQLKENIIIKFSYILGDFKIATEIETSNPKIQWLGKTNVLATLIYDLWQGQEKGRNEASTIPMLKAQKKDLEELLLNNFLDKEGKPLKASTISDYLNVSKPESRAKEGTRIELDY